ncbi:MT-A70 family protein [Trichomonas vaginalis G3]|uniref:mRNA m(6)A methyltransferase n=1 Tax=Trichomonas vaginalis (strain ATCC PRA-98 / G3) TaxID=412133 RepID=A2DLK7_TRIV3|nr:N6-adenosine-methyltransferase family [Trichomonas vaginalis G3]EAY18640.1 MT-A70 family protein [Trichomonas vaginalis G3]KAI5522525.1 N6-adenosine-methyltransferase family [Trichomonas vaginalis G3]|eukprot:XP_001579626.1 MT-A70 family protein [Trichomonas vaginalis G3]
MSSRAMKNRRVPNYRFSDSDDPDDGDWEDDSSSDEEDTKKKKKTSRKSRDYTWTDKPRKEKTDKSKSIPLSQMAYNPPAKFVTDFSTEDLHHCPGGDPCEFIEFEKLKDIVLRPEEYINSKYRGVNTFLTNFKPDDPDKLKYFGYNQELVKVDLNEIRAYTDEELDAEIEKIEAEIKKYDTKGDCTCTIVPAFDENIKHSAAIACDVREFPFDKLGAITQFDVITMDPPWLIAQASITRGVAINYDQLGTDTITQIPLHKIQKNGYIFLWVIASQLENGIQILNKWGYEFLTYLNWVKISKYGRYMPSHGYYLQHNKETVLIGRKGRDPENMRAEMFDDLIIQQRGLRQSHKPVEIYELIERVFPNSMYLEIFARPHNLREGWVSMGLELPK